MTGGIEIDQDRYDVIIQTAEAVKHIAADVAELKARKCPCDAVIKLQDDSTALRVRVAGIAAAVTFIGNWIWQVLQGVR